MTKKSPEFNKDGSMLVPADQLTDWEARQLASSSEVEIPEGDGWMSRASEFIKTGRRKVAVGALATGVGIGAVHLIGNSMDQNANEHYKLSHPAATNPDGGAIKP